EERAVLAADDGHLRSAPLVGGGDDVGETVAVDIARRDVHASVEGGRQSHEVTDQLQGTHIVDAYFGATSRDGAADTFGGAIAVDISDRHADAAGEIGREGEEGRLRLAGGSVIDVDL